MALHVPLQPLKSKVSVQCVLGTQILTEKRSVRFTWVWAGLHHTWVLLAFHTSWLAVTAVCLSHAQTQLWDAVSETSLLGLQFCRYKTTRSAAPLPGSCRREAAENPSLLTAGTIADAEIGQSRGRRWALKQKIFSNIPIVNTYWRNQVIGTRCHLPTSQGTCSDAASNVPPDGLYPHGCYITTCSSIPEKSLQSQRLNGLWNPNYVITSLISPQLNSLHSQLFDRPVLPLTRCPNIQAEVFKALGSSAGSFSTDPKQSAFG